MACRCTVDALRFFVRNVAQVDLPVSAGSTTSPRFSIRNFRPAPASAGRHLPHRAYSTASSSNDSLSLSGLTDGKSSSGSKRWPQRRPESQSATFDTESAFIDYSPDAIDAIAAKLVREKPFQQYETSSEVYDTPLKSLLKDPPLKKHNSAAPESRTTFRRTKVANQSFALHFSSPRKTDPKTKTTDRSTTKSMSRDDLTPPREHWQIDKEARSKKFPDGWNPQKRLSPDAIAGIRALHAQMPERYTTEALSQEFGVTAEAIRRILKSKWSPSPEEETDRQRRWFKRGQQVWSRYADLGVKPPKPWRELGIGKGKPEWMRRKQEWAKRQQEPRPLPALVTTARQKEAQAASEAASRTSSLADRIL